MQILKNLHHRTCLCCFCRLGHVDWFSSPWVLLFNNVKLDKLAQIHSQCTMDICTPAKTTHDNIIPKSHLKEITTIKKSYSIWNTDNMKWQSAALHSKLLKNLSCYSFISDYSKIIYDDRYKTCNTFRIRIHPDHYECAPVEVTELCMPSIINIVAWVGFSLELFCFQSTPDW